MADDMGGGGQKRNDHTGTAITGMSPWLFDHTLLPFLVGLFSAVHCLGMCGGIVGMLTAGLPPAIRGNARRRLVYLTLYNLARIASYTAAGAVTGLVGAGLVMGISPQWGHAILKALAALMLLGIGLYLAGWLPQLARLERLGLPLWRRLEPLAQRVLPVDRPAKALLFGGLWGWFPCGMVYTAVIYSGTSGGPWSGALFMFFFGLGTWPATFSAGILGGWVSRVTRRRLWRRAAGLVIVAFALLTLALPDMPEKKHSHFNGFHLNHEIRDE